LVARSNGSSKHDLLSRWTTIGAHRIHWRFSRNAHRSDLPAIVLVHGLIISGRYMIPTAKSLQPDFRTYLPDLPGFGLSSHPRNVLAVRESADVLAAWMRAIGLDRGAIFLGNSLGCQVIADLAVRYPHLVHAAILVGPTADPFQRGPIEHVIRLALDVPFEKPSLWIMHFSDLLSAGMARSLRTFYHLMTDRIERKLPHVQAPTLIVRGSRDTIVSERWVEHAASLLPRGEWVVIDRAPHAVNYAAPERLAEVVRRFLSDDVASACAESPPRAPSRALSSEPSAPPMAVE
jgi:pimeloyl-ACP methyl ester carboxylesterase